MVMPTFKPTVEQRKMVRAMSAYGLPQAEIALVIDIDRGTLANHFRREIDTASPEANAKVAQMLFNKAMKGDTACMIFWLKTRAGWRETLRISGDPETPVRDIVRSILADEDPGRRAEPGDERG